MKCWILAFWRVAWVLLALAAVPFSSRALAPDKTLLQYNCQNWSREQGVAGGKVSAITQTKDGYLWLATPKGLARFDGLEFKLFPINQQGQGASSLCKSKAGGLWFGIEGGGFGYFDGREFSLIDASKMTPSSLTSESILESKDGTIWMGTDLGVGHWVKENSAETFFDERPGNTMSLCAGARDRVFLGTIEHGLYCYQDGKIIPLPDETIKEHVVFCMAEDAQGNLWVGTENGLRCFDANFRPREIPPFYTEVKALMVDHLGTLWIGTSGAGLARYQGGQYTYLRKAEGLGNDFVTSLFEDAEGSIWVGTREGLSQVTDIKFPLYSANDGLLEGTCLSVAASARGGLWVANYRGVSYFDGRFATNYGAEAGFANVYTKRLFETRKGDLLRVGGNKSLEVVSGGKVVTNYSQRTWPVAMAEDAGGIVLSIGASLFRLQDGKLQPFIFKDGKGPTVYWINNICVARDDAIWLATVNGVVRIVNGEFKQWTAAEGLSSIKVNWICEDSDGAIWAGLMTGLTRFKDNQIKNITREDGLYDNSVFAIIPDDQGSFWMDSSRGIFRVNRKSLNDFAEGHSNQVISEGFEGRKASKVPERAEQEPSGCKTLDGRIWFPRSSGVVMIDPAHLFTNQVAPPVHIQEIRIDGQTLKDREIPELRPGDSEMEFHFTALSYLAPQKIRIRYQLEGFDGSWVEAGEHRSVTYANVKPGHYTFRVQAGNADGIWNTAGDSFAVQLPLPFYATTWFELLCGLVVLAGLVLVYRWKVRDLEENHQRLEDENDVLEIKVGRRTEELARANEALREEIGVHRETEARLKQEIAEREKVDKALAEQRNLLRTLIDSLPDNVFVKDLDSKVVISNVAHARSVGAEKPADVVGKTDFDFFPPVLAQKFYSDEQRVLKYGETYHAEEKGIYLATGKTKWKDTTKAPVFDSEGKIVGVAGINRDITERKEWENKREELHKQLVEASRHAGMAEVATGVLHNVGNVLNSVNVSASVLTETVRNSKAGNLTKVAAMLREHRDDLAQYLSTDAKGSRLPGYLEGLSDYLAAERETALNELRLLCSNIDHIKQIVTMQQANARLSGVVEDVPVTTLVEDSLKIHWAAFQRHGVQVVQEVEELPDMSVDRHKVLQILVNLLHNAKYACDETGKADKTVVIRVRRSSEAQVQFEVMDNGIGIPKDNLTRIFEHGFTTRKTGHGFGLHSAALAAKEMGGSLAVFSEGRGKGATFTLTLPLRNDAAIEAEAQEPALVKD